MTSDNDLQQDIRDELLRSLSGAAQMLNVQVLDGVVTLSGRIGSESAKWGVADGIGRLPGVQRVVNDIEVLTLQSPDRSADADTARPWFPSR